MDFREICTRAAINLAPWVLSAIGGLITWLTQRARKSRKDTNAAHRKLRAMEMRLVIVENKLGLIPGDGDE